EETDETTEPKKTCGKKAIPQVNATSMKSMVVNKTEKGKQGLKCMQANIKTKSAIQTRVTDQCALRNLRKGSKPVLPSIPKGKFHFVNCKPSKYINELYTAISETDHRQSKYYTVTEAI
ncbi:MAG: hypothetical protein AB2705_17830, partial [Candidatus Thiodiazotropha sp.]